MVLQSCRRVMDQSRSDGDGEKEGSDTLVHLKVLLVGLVDG